MNIIYVSYGGNDTPTCEFHRVTSVFFFTEMESIDLELGELFDHDAVDDGDEGEDIGAHAVGYGEDDAAADGAEGKQFRYGYTSLYDIKLHPLHVGKFHPHPTTKTKASLLVKVPCPWLVEADAVYGCQ